MLSSRLRTELRTAVDDYGLTTVLREVREVCEDKAARYQNKWKNHQLTDQWAEAGAAIKECIEKIPTFDKAPA